MLKTDYKNSAWSGERKYKSSQNADGSYSVRDVTNYSVLGDGFGADEINEISEAVNTNTSAIGNINARLELLGGIEVKQVSLPVTVPAGSSSAQKTLAVSIPVGDKTIIGVTAMLNDYPLPYFVNGTPMCGLDQAFTYDNGVASISIWNKTSAWTNYTLNLILFLR